MADNKKGWTFTFFIWSGISPDKDQSVKACVLGEVGDITLNNWDDDRALYYMDDDHAQSIALDAVCTKYETTPDRVQWAETDKYHPDHLLGLSEVDIGVWI
jgi:hypothetical protein